MKYECHLCDWEGEQKAWESHMQEKHGLGGHGHESIYQKGMHLNEHLNE